MITPEQFTRVARALPILQDADLDLARKLAATPRLAFAIAEVW